MLTLRDSREQHEFRLQIRGLLGDEFDPGLAWAIEYADLLAVDRFLSEHDLLAIGWPKDVGGRELSPQLEAVLSEELGEYGINRAVLPSHQGINNLGPALLRHGTEEQRRTFIPRILQLEDIWCQGFSEPDAGSDLAGVRTTARTDGQEFVLNGEKTWTSMAGEANWIYVLCRTGPVDQRHKNLSMLLVPMDSQGLEVRPIKNIVGGDEFSSVSFTDVRVPLTNALGEPGSGWSVAMTVLGSERLSGRYRYQTIRNELDQLVGDLDAADRIGSLDSADLVSLGRSVAEVDAILALSQRIDSARAAGTDLGVSQSINKLWWPAAHQRATEVGLTIAAEHGLDDSPYYTAWLNSRAESVYGGSAQIQSNIIAERGLGMPR